MITSLPEDSNNPMNVAPERVVTPLLIFYITPIVPPLASGCNTSKNVEPERELSVLHKFDIAIRLKFSKKCSTRDIFDHPPSIPSYNLSITPSTGDLVTPTSLTTEIVDIHTSITPFTSSMIELSTECDGTKNLVPDIVERPPSIPQFTSSVLPLSLHRDDPKNMAPSRDLSLLNFGVFK